MNHRVATHCAQKCLWNSFFACQHLPNIELCSAGPCLDEFSACFEKYFHFTATDEINVIGIKFKIFLWLYSMHGANC